MNAGLASPSARALALLLACTGLAVGAEPPAAPPTEPVPPANVYQPPPPTVPPVLEKLGGERYRIGSIQLDKKRRSFVAPGRIIHLDDAPLEYVAVSRGGYKGYESLIELDSTGSEFNLACILAGFERKGGTVPKFQFDPARVEGPAVQIELQWRADGRPNGKITRIPLHEALQVNGREGAVEPVTADWVYLGSFVLPDTRNYAADAVGTVIGFVHDPASIIEHGAGLGIGAYGTARANLAVLPPVGTPIEIVVSVPR